VIANPRTPIPASTLLAYEELGLAPVTMEKFYLSILSAGYLRLDCYIQTGKIDAF
jgi:hypothetical protein